MENIYNVLVPIGITILCLTNIYCIINIMNLTKRITNLENDITQYKLDKEHNNKKGKHMKLFEGDK